MTQKIGFLGANGSYSHQAAHHFVPDAEYISLPSFDALVNAAETGEIDHAVLPLENSSSGRIPEVHRLVATMELFAVGELLLPIEHVLVAKPPCDPTAIHTILSHPQGFLQTSEFLSKTYPEAVHKTTSDTATAVKEVIEKGDRGYAAIGSEFASKLYGATVINTNISNRSDNITRFIMVSKEVQEAPTNNITSIILQVRHTPGALVSALSVFGEFDINIFKLETYMVSHATRLPTFYLDIGCGSHEERLVHAMKKLREHITFYKFIGTYEADKSRSGLNGFLEP